LVPGQRQRLSDQLYGQLLDQIVSGAIGEGDRLPSEKDICAMFGVSRPVVRQALMRLRADGLVHGRQGAGSFVMSRPLARLAEFASTDQLAAMLRCVELRLPLEGAAAKLAAERRTAEQLAHITEAHALFQEEAERGEMSPDTDFTFHTSIIAATDNEFFASAFAAITATLSRFMTLTHGLMRTGSLERKRQVLGEHAAILDAIRGQDAEAAQIAMQFHIGSARRRIVNRNRDS
jgi:GntR family transcriptional repressor for pyruvate dehydrogenase complex